MVAVACGGPGAVPEPAPSPGVVQWARWLAPYPTRIGQLDPVPVSRVLSPDTLRLDLGGMFVEHSTPTGIVRELLLYFRIRGGDVRATLTPDTVALAIDGHAFRYVPDPRRTLTGVRAERGRIFRYVLVPVDADVLGQLRRARFVTGRIGTDLHFEARPGVLGRLGALLDVLLTESARPLGGIDP